MAKDKENGVQNETTPEAENQEKKCGIIMPISESIEAGYPPGHWRDVLSIISEAFEGTGFTPNLVSKKDSIGLIHESIVTNIYSNEIIVCDVSTKNPNVMFELGLRLAFDKPVIIIKDEKTEYSFDTGPIEHLNYPSSLRFQDIVSFKKDLKTRALATHEAAKAPNYSPYLKSFNKAIVPAKIENIEVKDLQFIVDSIKTMSADIERLSDGVNKEQIQFNSVRRSENKVSPSYDKTYSLYRKTFIPFIEQLIDEKLRRGAAPTLDQLTQEVLVRAPNTDQLITYDTRILRNVVSDELINRGLLFPKN